MLPLPTPVADVCCKVVDLDVDAVADAADAKYKC